jgi:hypothetical protein
MTNLDIPYPWRMRSVPAIPSGDCRTGRLELILGIRMGYVAFSRHYHTIAASLCQGRISFFSTTIPAISPGRLVDQSRACRRRRKTVREACPRDPLHSEPVHRTLGVGTFLWGMRFLPPRAGMMQTTPQAVSGCGSLGVGIHRRLATVQAQS